MELIQTKLSPPIEPRGLIDRPHLLARLRELESARLILVQAPAGYGKTSVLAQWHHSLQQQAQAVGWVTTDSSLNESDSELVYLAAAIARAEPKLAAAIEPLLDTERYLTSSQISTAIINILAQAERPIFLFLDDIHWLSSPTLTALFRLVELAPPTVHFICASRTIPEVGLARLRAHGDLLELGVEDLLFRRNEIGPFLRHAGHRVPRGKELEMLQTRTEGWVTGIKLASLAWRGKTSASDFLRSFSGSRRAVTDFFVEEVLAGQPAEIRSFLLATSILDRLSAPLCDAIIGADNARQLLDQLETSGLFILNLDDERVWYRYHHLFAESLRRQLRELDPAAEARYCARASEWLYQEGWYAEAIEYALKAQDPERAARILADRTQDMTYTGGLWVVMQFAQQIPMDVLRRHPIVLLDWAWMLTRNLRFEEVRRLLQLVRDRLQELREQPDTPDEKLHELEFLLQHREMTLAAAQDDVIEVEALCQRLMQQPHEHDPYLAATIHSHLLYAQRVQYKLADIEQVAAKAHGNLVRSGYRFGLASFQALVGPSLFFAGKFDTAERALEEGLEQALQFNGEHTGLAALPALPLSQIAYERNQLERAQELLSKYMPLATELSLADQLIPGYLIQTRVHIANNDLTAADATLEEGMAVALDRDLERLRLALVTERIRLLLQHSGSPEQAAQYGHAAGIPNSPEALVATSQCTTALEAKAVAWMQIALAQDRIPEAINLAKQWRSFCSNRGAVYSLIRWTILLVSAQLIGGDARTAQRTLREAIAQAAPIRSIRSFLDAGPAIQTLLEQAAGSGPTANHPTDLFAQELLRELSPESQADSVAIQPLDVEGLYGRLTERELEILALVGAGMRNAEVAAKLGMTEGSIKWYMQQIYDKMGTRRRLQAVERARQLGLVR